ncbi:mucin-3B-like [Saccostrea cucullata]|uniref:mucin-3B-like n=1 Tax=Saccostrea cuccullata TaxID=36930 RepID=UPI002ED0396F
MMGSSRCHVVIYAVIFISQALAVPDDLRTLCPRDIALDPQYVWIHGSACLQISLDKHDWPHARERCQRHGGDLVQIRNADMQGSIIEKIRQVHHHIKEGFWIGASDQHHEGRWEWVSGDKTMTYDNWSPHQGPHQTGFLLIPGGGTEDCGLLKVTDHYMWHDYPCHSGIAFFYPYICQFDIPQTTQRPETTPTPKPTSAVTTTKLTKTTTHSSTISTTKPNFTPKVTESTSSATHSTSIKSSTTKEVSSIPAMTTKSLTSTKITLLSLLTSKFTMTEKTNGISLISNKITSEGNPKLTTEELEILVTEQGQTSTTTAKSEPEGMIIIG